MHGSRHIILTARILCSVLHPWAVSEDPSEQNTQVTSRLAFSSRLADERVGLSVEHMHVQAAGRGMVVVVSAVGAYARLAAWHSRNFTCMHASDMAGTP